MDKIDKVRANRLRLQAERRGFKLSKSFRRDPLALDYNRFYLYPRAPEVTPPGHDPEKPIFQGMIDEVELFLHPGGLEKLLGRKT
jgi:hypothetical protein